MADINKQLDELKETNYKEYLKLIVLVQLYNTADNENKANWLELIKTTLNKASIKYIDDITGAY